MLAATMLDIHLAAICARHQFTTNPAPVIEELRTAAGPHTQLLSATVGRWVGYFDHPDRNTLIGALLDAFPGARGWLQEGESRRARLVHSNTEYLA